MRRTLRKRVVFGLIAMIVAILGYRLYLFFIETDFQSVHGHQLTAIEQPLNAETYRFAVVGNINNSVGLFERNMVPLLNRDEAAFVISAGNAVSGGGEDKYRALYRTLEHLEKPYLLTVGPNETEALGAVHFYRHFGPFFYTLTQGNQFFAFLDGTSEETYRFQLQWLEKRLKQTQAQNRFVFIAQPLWDVGEEPAVDFDSQYLAQDPASERFRTGLIALFERYQVDVVFSANLHLFDQREKNDVRYVTTGGAGGLVINDDTSYYHYVSVDVDGAQISINEHKLDIGQHPIMKHLESLWFFVHSLFYVGHLNFLLIMAVLIIIAVKLYGAVFEEKDYYPNYDLDLSPFLKRPLRIAMMTNNYLPFVGGVPISIARLARGLVAKGHSVLVIAPDYQTKDQAEQDQSLADGFDVVRLPSWLKIGAGQPFRLANLFSTRVKQALQTFKPDLIHVHHPFWLGRLGLIWGRRLGVPVVLTYHTRLEHYAHFVPLPSPLFRNVIVHGAVRRFANRCDAVIVPTASAEEYLRLIGVKRPIYVHPTGIEYSDFQQTDTQNISTLKQRWGIEPGQVVLVSVARLSPEKNFEFMLQALASLTTKTNKSFKCLIVGEGESRETLQAQIDSLGLTDKVLLVGKVRPDQMPSLYQLGDIFVFASRSETQGMVILEAMAGGLPVVAVRASGIDDVIEQNQTGIKTPENHQAWSKAVQTLIEEDDLRQRMSEAAQAFAKEFDIEPYAASVQQTYAEILAEYAQVKISRKKRL
ncbi:glycosyltransferase [Thiomicrospira sp.]|uniref:glycosyltransferase n=1 Tax=Thiomicrospira sp. TaxID=935 RepID=UPI002F9391CF